MPSEFGWMVEARTPITAGDALLDLLGDLRLRALALAPGRERQHDEGAVGLAALSGDR